MVSVGLASRSDDREADVAQLYPIEHEQRGWVLFRRRDVPARRRPRRHASARGAGVRGGVGGDDHGDGVGGRGTVGVGHRHATP